VAHDRAGVGAERGDDPCQAGRERGALVRGRAGHGHDSAKRLAEGEVGRGCRLAPHEPV